MPELPEVETVVRGLRSTLTGQRIAKASVFSLKIRTAIPAGLDNILTGATILDVRRRAKYILIPVLPAGSEMEQTLVIHLGMTGNFHVTSGASASEFKPGRHDHLRLCLSNGTTVLFSDPRRFGRLDLVESRKLDDWPPLRQLGPEPLERGFDGARLAAILAGRKTPIKQALMDQQNVVGVGNIYASEALFYAGISPLSQAHTVKGDKAALLCAMIKKVLRASIKAGGSTLKDYRQASGDMGFFQHKFAVYGREGEPCPGCDCNLAKTGGIQRIIQGGRSTFFCPRKQK